MSEQNLDLSKVAVDLVSVGETMDTIVGKFSNLIAFIGLGVAAYGKFGKSAREAGSATKEMQKNIKSISSSVSGMNSSLNSAVKSVKSLGNNITKSISKLPSELKKSGKDIGKAIADGITSGLKGKMGKVTEVTKDAAGKVISTTEKEFQIASPSKKMKKIGEYVAEGLGDGIKSGAKEAASAMEKLSDEVVDSSDSMKKVSKNAKGCVKSFEDVGDASDKLGEKKISFGGGFVAVAAVVATLVGYFIDLISTNEEFSSKRRIIPHT